MEVSVATKSVGFAIEEGDRPRLEMLVEKFGGGNRSAFLRVAMSYMEAVDRAERLRAIQSYGAKKSLENKLSPEELESIVHRVLGQNV